MVVEISDVKKMLKPNIKYAFTVNTSQQYFKQNSLHRPRLMTQYLITILNQWVKPYADYELYPEIQQKSGRYHLHGFLTIRDSFNFHLITLYRLSKLSIFKIEPIIVHKDKPTWKQYVLKNKDVMSKALKQLHLPYKLTNSVSIKEEDPNVNRDILSYFANPVDEDSSKDFD